MKLTREQISNLSDIELNRAMVWLYPELNSFLWVDTGAKVWVGPRRPTNPSWSYLLNYNLTMPLAFGNNLTVIPCMTGRYLVTRYAGTENVEAANKNPLRALCEVLVMIAMEAK